MGLFDWWRRPGRPNPPAPPVPPGPAGDVAGLLDALNRERSARGTGPLAADARLTTAAAKHAADMAAHRRLSHAGRGGSSFTDRMAREGWSGQTAAENIAAGQRTAAEVTASWMGSPGHRANILNRAHTAAGLGAARAADGTVYWCAVFGG